MDVWRKVQKMRRTFTIITMFALALALVVSAAFAAKEKKHEYVGAKKCKICHKVQHKSWSETPHAKAFDLLSDEEKKKDECIACHSTGTTAKGVFLEGIQCEACHGPGSHYKSAKIMSKKKWKTDPEKYLAMAIKAGLNIPTEETCKQCHQKEGNPNFKPFDFAKRKHLVHTITSDSTEAKPAKAMSNDTTEARPVKDK